MSQVVFTKYSPYLVVEGDVKNREGKEFQHSEVVSYCRCGKSSNQPYCDGTHSKEGFDGSREKSPKEHREVKYQGDKIAIFFDTFLCCHAGLCVKLNSVFKPKHKVTDWVDPNGASVEAIVETIKKCPSGALSYEIDGVHYRNFHKNDRTEIFVIDEGPLVVIGDVPIHDDQNSKELLTSTDHYCLCRCGKSHKKPFCDGSHKE